jgi:hypothetical protein
MSKLTQWQEEFLEKAIAQGCTPLQIEQIKENWKRDAIREQEYQEYEAKQKELRSLYEKAEQERLLREENRKDLWGECPQCLQEVALNDNQHTCKFDDIFEHDLNSDGTDNV